MKLCKYCDKPAIYHRKVSNELVCQDHFCKTIENKIRRTVRKYNMFTPKDKVVVGVSGGKDSLVLLYNVIKLQKRNPYSPNVEAILIDEGISGYREESISLAKQICQKWKVKLYVIPFKNNFGAKLDQIIQKIEVLNVNACTICGTVRRRLLNETARELKADKLAVGHNLDDISETFLQNILRNDIYKIRQKPPDGNPLDPQKKFIPRVKPLMEIPEAEITRYCYYKKIPIQQKPCPYVQKYYILRKEVQNFINLIEEHSAEIKYNLLRANETLHEILNNNFEKTKNINKKKNKYGLCEICGEPKGPTRKICFFCELKNKLDL